MTLPRRPATARSCRYLFGQERTTLADLHRHGVGVQAIARDIGRSASTVSRELRRKRDTKGRYLPHTADRLATERMARPRLRRLAADTEIAQAVCVLLGKRWSPEQIAHELRLRYPGQRARTVCPKAIYQAIYDPDVASIRPAKTALRTGRRRRRRRLQGLERRGRLAGMTMIDQRPAQVVDRVQASVMVARVGAEKRQAVMAAAQVVEDQMTVGLGTGTTVAYLLPALAAQGLSLRCVATSPRTERAAVAAGLVVEPFEFARLDVAIDGADQISSGGWLVKDGGGAHTREKMIAAAAQRFVVIADAADLAAVLAATPGVVEHGLFPPQMVSLVLVGRGDSVQRIEGAKR